MHSFHEICQIGQVSVHNPRAHNPIDHQFSKIAKPVNVLICSSRMFQNENHSIAKRKQLCQIN